MSMLTQEELNASIVIDALSRLAAINTDPRFWCGAGTLALVRGHVRGWDDHTRKEIHGAVERIFTAESATSVNAGATTAAKGATESAHDRSSSSMSVSRQTRQP